MQTRTELIVEAALDAALGEIRRQGGPDYLLAEARHEGITAAKLRAGSLRPNKVIAKRVEMGDYVRACGDAVCRRCGEALYDHPEVSHYECLRWRCDGTLVKL